MFPRRSFIHMGLFIALLAAALLALAPTLARAQRSLQPADPMWLALHEVCVAQGVVKVLGDAGGSSASAEHEDCRFCQGAAALDLPPPAGSGLQLAPKAALAYPLLYWQAPRSLHAWLTPAPRGPPSVS